MGLTLRQAAERCGASRSTIHRALKSGKLSGARSDSGAWDIDPAELARAFPWDVTEQVQRDGAGHGAAVLSVKVEMLEQQLERERDTVADLRRRLDKAEDRVLALTAPAVHSTKPERRLQRSLWERLRYVMSGYDN